MSMIQHYITQYRQGLEYRRQARALGTKSLTVKFEHHGATIAKIGRGENVRGVPQDECDLIRACLAESARLKAKASELTLARLAREAGVTERTLRRAEVAA